MWFGVVETSEIRISAELKTKHPPFDQNHFSIPISDSKTSNTFPGGADNPGNPKKHLLNSPGIPSPWDAHSKPFFFDKVVNPWLLLPSPLLSPGIPRAQSWNPDQEFPSQGFWGMEKLPIIPPLILMELLILGLFYSCKLCLLLSHPCIPRDSFPQFPNCPGGVYQPGVGIGLVKPGFQQRIPGRRRNFCSPQLTGTKEMPQGKFRWRKTKIPDFIWRFWRNSQ